ncbi:peptidoglycan DD-metalloendopeptidase family protein [Epilithonimonas lactis]|uniref:M23ase beta-sheet core domain-containing protein n=1 Tax=Epilithonimonas lactis TaxID=421072 RepID=A0A085B7G5_9FLAO|nr:peptidoglycan DD-metalloendopeptidase family protein [Epilithonimonas lactis]KFC18410.1 hypothetical protein IO89_18125 [Epilithonimonas lactis]SER02090.1 Predicted chitinase [Epilithonimonas lactis]
MNIIKGNPSPKAEEKNFYEISSMFEFGTSPFVKQPVEKYIWTLFKKDKTLGWKQVSNNIKYGEKVPYTFGEKVVGIPYKIEVHKEGKNLLNVTEKKLIADLIVTPKSFKEPVIGRVILLNRGNANINKAKFNESLSAEARTSNLFGKEITFYLWEEGASESEKYKKPKTARVDKNGIAKVQFSLMDYATQPTIIDFFSSSKSTKKFFVTAIYGMKEVTNRGAVEVSNEKSPSQQTSKPSEGTVTSLVRKSAEIIAEGLGNISDYFSEKAKTLASVNKTELEQRDNKGNCIPCQIGLTVQDLDKFMKATPHGSILNTAPFNTRIPAYISYLNQYMIEFEINKNCYRRANFLGQVAKETKFWSYKEDFVYNSSVLKSKFSSFKTEQGGRHADSWGYLKNKSEVTKEREIKIANWAYSRGSKAVDLGNKICPENDLTNPEQDGYKYRGRGLIQLTGRNNYTNFQSWFNDNRTKLKLPDVDFISNPDLVFEPQYIVLSAIYFWIKNGLNDIADAGVSKETVQKISDKINSGEKQVKKDMRYDYVRSAHSMLSEKAKDCPLKTNYKTPSGKWHDPVDNPQLCLYSQGGGSKKPWHGSFGPTIRDGVSVHTGMDLFAKPGTNVYACVKGQVVRSEINTSMFGEMIVIKVIDDKTIKARRKNPFTLKYAHKSEIESQNFDHDGTFYLVYAHLKERRVAIDDIVDAGKVIGLTGTSGNRGVPFSTKNPHLHFEIMNVERQAGLNNKCNPGVYLTYKDEDDLTATDIAQQEEARTTPKFWKQ